MVKAPPWQRPSSALAPPHAAPGGSGQLSTPRKRPAHWTPRRCLGCSSQPPPLSLNSQPLTITLTLTLTLTMQACPRTCCASPPAARYSCPYP
eukprot:scaffold79849_cov53-Phaeocystis_antarctica.AAC.1